MKFVLAPDSFKGTISALEASTIMKNNILKHYPSAIIEELPIADGGEGSVDAVLRGIGGEKIYCKSTGPFGEKLKVYYGMKENTAIIEMASCAGITIPDHLDPSHATTYGVGSVILDAIKNGAKKIILGLGGSCTNDMGVGAAIAMGAKFYNKDNEDFFPSPLEFGEITNIDLTDIKKTIGNVEICAMCDITNPLYGEHGAAYVFAPQKGANKNLVKKLDKNLILLSNIIKEKLNIDVSSVEGSGAAGGMGAGIIAFFGGKLTSGINTILDLFDFDSKIKDADFIFTGEGKINSQSVDGKVISGIATRAKRQNVPVIALCGAIGDVPDKVYDMGVTTIMSINQQAMDFKESKAYSKENLEAQMDHIIRLIKNIKGE